MNSVFRTILTVAVFSMTLSCSTGKKPEPSTSTFATSLRVFALILEEITGESNDIQVLISETQSPHAFHPRPSDMNRLSGSTLLILGDPELDGWAEELGDLDILYLASLLQPSDLLADGESTNPHFWTDPQLIRRILNGLTANLCEADPEECQNYQENAIRFDAALAELDNELKSLLQPLRGACVFTAQPFYDYFLTRYSIVPAGVIEAVPGYEPSAAHLVEMIGRAKTMSCIGIIAQRRLSDTSARLFASESGIPLVYLDPIGSASVRSYADLLQQNAEVLLSLLEDAP